MPISDVRIDASGCVLAGTYAEAAGIVLLSGAARAGADVLTTRSRSLPTESRRRRS